jgi:hypothetical protein
MGETELATAKRNPQRQLQSYLNAVNPQSWEVLLPAPLGLQTHSLGTTAVAVGFDDTLTG